MGHSRERIDYRSEVVDLFDESADKSSSADFEDITVSSDVSEKVLVGLKDRKFEARLEKDFYPQYDKKITVKDSAGDTLSIPVSDLQFLAFVNKPFLIEELQINDFSEVVEIYGGDSYEMRVPAKQNFHTGMYGEIIEPQDGFKYIYITFDNIRTHYQKRLIGEIIVEKHILTQDIMQNVLNKQVQLRNLRLGAIIAKKINLAHREVESIVQRARQQKSADNKDSLGDILIKAGLVTPEVVEQSVSFQKRIRNMKIGKLLVEMGYTDEIQLYKVLAEKFRKRFISLAETTPDSEALQNLPYGLISKLRIVPVDFQNKRLIIATSHPEKAEINDILREKISCPFELVVAPHNQIMDIQSSLQPR